MKRILICHNTGKILFLHYEYLIRSLVERKMDVICVTPSDEAIPSILATGAKHISWNVSQHSMNPWRELQTWLKLSEIIKDVDPDIFLGITIKPNLYGALALLGTQATKRFFMFSGLGYVFTGKTVKQKVLRHIVNYAIKFSFRNANGVYFQNQDDADSFVKNRIITRQQAIVIKGTGIDTDLFSLKDYINNKNRPVNFLFVGRILADKGVYEFVAAAKKVLDSTSNANFLLLGPLDKNPAAIKYEEIQQWEREGIIQYLGVAKNVKPFLLDADVFVLPSYREGLSRAALEAMAMGLPIITTDAPGCRQTVDHGTSGYIVKTRDVIELAKAMRYFIKNRELIIEMGKMSRQKVVNEFDVHQVVDSIIKPLGV